MTPLDPAQEEALQQITDAVAPAQVVLIGAAAIGVHVPMTWRGTSDLDLVLAIDVDVFGALSSRLPGWRCEPRREHAWKSPRGVELDLLPAGASLRGEETLVFPGSGNEMDLTGIDLAFGHAVLTRLGGCVVHIAPVEVLAVLKMVAWLDSPHRLHDLEDLAHILEAWLPLDDERRYEDDIVAAQVPYDDVPALLLGRAIRAVAKEPHRDVVRRFLDHVSDERRGAHGYLQSRGPISWRNDDALLPRRLAALREGVGI